MLVLFSLMVVVGDSRDCGLVRLKVSLLGEPVDCGLNKKDALECVSVGEIFYEIINKN